MTALQLLLKKGKERLNKQQNKEKNKPSFIQVDVPNTCKSWKERRELLSITRKFLEQNIKIVKNE